MSKGIPENYPTGCSNDELLDKIKEYQYRVKQLASSENSILGSTYWKDISDLKSDEIWMQRQIDSLESNNEELIKLNQNLNKIITIQESDSTSI